MTSLSLTHVDICVKFMDGAGSVYGKDGLSQGTNGAVGFDLKACINEDETIFIPAGERRMVPTGIAIEPVQGGVAGFVYSRSGLGGVQGVVVAQGVGVIDPDYRGEIKVPLLNTGAAYTVHRGDRVAQLVFQPYFRPVFKEVEELNETDRGVGGFGHTGR